MWFFFYLLSIISMGKGRLARKRIGNFLFLRNQPVLCLFTLPKAIEKGLILLTDCFPSCPRFLWLALMIGPHRYCFNALAIFKGRRRLRKKNAYLITIHIVSGLVLWSSSWFLGWLEFQRKVKEGKEEKTCNELNKEGRQGKEKIELQT